MTDNAPAPIDELRSVIARLRGNPDCKTCHGRGYVGLTVVNKLPRTVNCHCAHIVDDDSQLEKVRAEIMTRVDDMEKRMAAMQVQTLLAIEGTFRHTAFGWPKVKWGQWKERRRKKEKQ